MRYQPGWITLAGLLIGALVGWIAEPGAVFPVGTASGLAVGVGIDSLLNRHINGPFTSEAVPETELETDHGANDHAAR
ncbi:MAG: hypothetical protein K8S97_01540 [Anaerolineae bacterium]|nr:hypothetical protein [Anaerolineae bacterium]